ncbi:MAG: hypothetical protein MZV63_05465 [Marinilabiliales bacterium]|nr:hypothetical protein [Marinilabiliales bacterium]
MPELKPPYPTTSGLVRQAYGHKQRRDSDECARLSWQHGPEWFRYAWALKEARAPNCSAIGRKRTSIRADRG